MIETPLCKLLGVNLYFVYDGVMLFTAPVSHFRICDTGVEKKALIYETAPCVRHTPRITSELSRLVCHDEELSRKPSSAENGTVVDEIRRILVHRQNIQTGVANNVFCDIAERSRHGLPIA